MTSREFINRFSRSRNGKPILPLYRNDDSANDYDLDELDPQPMDTLLSPQSPDGPSQRFTSSRTSHPGDYSPSRRGAGPTEQPQPQPQESRVLLASPPRPITEITKKYQARDSQHPMADSHAPGSHNVASSLLNIGSVFFDKHPKNQHHSSQASSSLDSIWRNFRHQEKALVAEIQEVLDMQAAGLSGRPGDSTSSVGEDSDAGSSTPTGTSFYSTATSKSKMAKSLHMPTRSTPAGDIIPVRQPMRPKPLGVRTAREELRRRILALGALKAEEDECLGSYISQRKRALAHLNKLASRRQRISSELRSFEDDDEEPLGKELRELVNHRDSMTTEIRELERKLVSLRNQRRSVKERIQDVQNRREAGLSGYRGALKEVEAKVDLLVRRPPVRPLDREFWLGPNGQHDANGAYPSSGGDEFLSLIPERRTLDMAKSWWEAEINALEERQQAVVEEQDALYGGQLMWKDTMDLVSTFEAGLAKLIKGGASRKGKERAYDSGDDPEDILTKMSDIKRTLDEKLKVAEENRWNLLICAVGAELETFKKAMQVLRDGFGLVPAPDPEPAPAPTSVDREDSTTSMESPAFKASVPHVELPVDEGDNDVPQDLLTSALPEEDHSTPREPSPAGNASFAAEPHTIGGRPGPDPERRGSGDSVPSEFLAEHDPEES